MATRRYVVLTCDTVGCSGQFRSDPEPALDIPAARDAARALGWLVVDGYARHRCPRCASRRGVPR